MKKIGVYTSGGDSPGMNAAIRAVVRSGIASGVEVIGIRGGYSGMIEGHFDSLNLRSVANIIQRGGTFLKTGRSSEFLKTQGRSAAAEQLKKESIEGLICIGGDGSFRGARALFLEHQIAVVGIPGTIDNDLFGTDTTIGFDTAVNTALDAIDKIRDTAAAHDRVFIIEVMGRNTGHIAAMAGLAGGAEEVFAPDVGFSIEKSVDRIKLAQSRGKMSSILVAAEGHKAGRVYDLAEQIRRKSGLDPKVCILGHQQRGGAPSASDRVLASRLGAAAVAALLAGQKDIMLGTEGLKIISVPFEIATSKEKPTSKELLNLVSVLAN